jgi:hypothetical protein
LSSKHELLRTKHELLRLKSEPLQAVEVPLEKLKSVFKVGTLAKIAQKQRE